MWQDVHLVKTEDVHASGRFASVWVDDVGACHEAVGGLTSLPLRDCLAKHTLFALARPHVRTTSSTAPPMLPSKQQHEAAPLPSLPTCDVPGSGPCTVLKLYT